ncbi:hypothetical protein N5D61_09155 [Pseudomonas sp. GD03842]|uniref:hypothetical protein n=1 Tax=Pseudomonas sp. GD03842 TaxID=2975385 RepID=UPI00244A45C1|nr:hypothetical protein [Pseudomonas sp. GD03842]MDH0746511.1 hypothetical protein [Pseudomonas sp. GD03842]
MIRALLLLCVVLLSACTSHAPLPAQIPHIKFPKQLHVQREQGGLRQDWLVTAHKERHGLRWSLTDPSGTLLAREQMYEEAWTPDSSLPPNPEARELFAAVLFALTSNEEARFDYPGVVLLPHARTLEDRWRVDYASEGIFRITLESGELTYIVSPVGGKASK